MNIAKLLEKAPVGTKLYSPLFGDLSFLRINYKSDIKCPIICETTTEETVSFTKEGKSDNRFPGECMIFPSRENRDWSTFTVEHVFKPFDQVLVRSNSNFRWRCTFYSHRVKDGHICIDGVVWKYCIPYIGNENLVGSTDKPD